MCNDLFNPIANNYDIIALFYITYCRLYCPTKFLRIDMLISMRHTYIFYLPSLNYNLKASVIR